MNDRLPILVGAGQLTEKLPPAEAKTPLEMMLTVTKKAADDAGLTEAQLSQLDAVGCTRLVVDSTEIKIPGIGRYSNIPKSIANHFDATLKHGYYASAGGNTPQMLVNTMAEKIANGDSDFVLLAGSENLNTLVKSFKEGVKINWDDDPGGEPETLGNDRNGVTPHEEQYGLMYPINTYPLFENAIRAQRGATVAEHQKSMAEMFSAFSRVAADNPYSWFPTYRSVEEICTIDEKNRYVGFPYPKYLNAVMQVDMAAAVIMMSVGKAKELGIDRSRWVFLNGCGDAYDHWEVTSRVNYHSSPAMKAIGESALAMAGTNIDEIDFFDIYSCFPSAVEIACQEFGIAEDDPRGLTLTGGLPYFGGPGNNYVMHSIVEMMNKLRANPGTKGLLNGNGWFVTKHSIGVYSTEPAGDEWSREAQSDIQARIDAMPKPAFTETPEGEATVETYTVVHLGKDPKMGIVIGRLADGTRFVANTPNNQELLEKMKEVDCMGVSGRVENVKGKNIFTPAI